MANAELTYTPLESGITEIRDVQGKLLGAAGLDRTVVLPELPPMGDDKEFGSWGDTPDIIGHVINQDGEEK